MKIPNIPSGVTAGSLLDKIEDIVKRRIDALATFRATLVASDANNNWTIQRLSEDTPSEEAYARIQPGKLVTGQEVACIIIGGKPVILGRLRRAVGTTEDADFDVVTVTEIHGTVYVNEILADTALDIDVNDPINFIDTSVFTGLATFNGNIVGNATNIFTTVDVDNLHIVEHMSVTGNAPTIATGTAAGTGASWTITGNDNWGWIELVVGTTPSATAENTVLNVTMRNAWANANYSVLIHPRNQLTGKEQLKVYARASTSSVWTMRLCDNVGLTAGATYRWSYFMGGVV